MRPARPVVRAVVRDLSRTGVPLALARLAAWPGTREAIDLHVVARSDGPVRVDLEQAGIAVVALEPERSRSVPATVAAAGAQLGRPAPGQAVLAAAWRRRLRGLPQPNTVLVQGAGAWPVAEALGIDAAPRLVWHLHELALGLRRSIDPATARRAAATADQVLVVAEPVAALARSLGAPSERVTIVPGTVDRVERLPRSGRDVVTIGEAGWRKGTDRAIAAAHELRRRDPGVRWHWIGRASEPAWAYAHGADLAVVFHPPCEAPWAVVDAPAAAVVTSREDPLPLVALEAGARGLPVVACAGSGGLDQLLDGGRGWLVDPTDPGELVAAVQEAIATGSAGRGEELQAYVAAHHRADAVGPAWLAALTGAGGRVP
jgi:glycosyltransferase involved in cell wall biosynthesis